MSDWAETCWESLEGYRDSELLKSFHSDIQDDRHGGQLGIFKRRLLPNLGQIEPKLDWGHRSDIEIQNC